jgi:ABC-type glutathione transport system ATPase component
MTEPLLVVERLTKTFGRGRAEATAVADVSFALAPGGALGIVGESGSGRTTTARMISGLERPSGGRILFRGEDRTHPARSARSRREQGREIQTVFQAPCTSLDRGRRVGD